MAAKMQMLVEDPQLSKDLGKAGIERVRKSYSWDRFFNVFDKRARQVAKL